MRSVARTLVVLLCLLAFAARSEDAAELEAKGIAALKLSQNESDAIVSAAIYFGQATELYQSAKNNEKATEMNSFLYWCKKKMTLQQMDAFLKGGDAINVKIAQRMKEIEAAPPPDEAQAYFNRADAYANAHPNEHLLIAMRFYEVADRFKGTDLSLQAQDRSLKEMTLEKGGAANTSASARENPVAAPVDPAKKIALPPAAKQKEAEKTIKDLYKEEFAKSAPKDKAALATKLEREADESANDPPARYVLLTQAATLAAQAGELDRLAGILDKLSAAFESDFKDFKKAQLSAAMSKITDAKLAKVASALKVLIDNPDDAAANLTLGKYKLQAGDIEHAAAFISKSKNAALVELMKQEQAAPTDGTGQAALGDAWWKAGEKAGEKDDKALFRQRASAWYEKARGTLTGLARAKVEKRLASSEPARAPSSSKVINLIRLIDVRRDISKVHRDFAPLKPKWEIKQGELISNEAAPNVLQIAYQPPAEYDYTIVFTRNTGNDAVLQVLCANGHQFGWIVASDAGKYARFELIDGNKGHGIAVALTNGQKYTSTVEVRRSGVKAYLDGKLIAEHNTDFHDMTLDPYFKIPDTTVLGISTWGSSYTFHSIEVIELSGPGKLLHTHP
ncbi:MAG TPA: hypothetical protein VKX17_06370 [Planctomycetota bacterium]|nr:hypothetical protein [Planctomycetota bacterium]